MRRLAVATLLLASIVLSSMWVSGCAYRRADRSLVQPFAFSKQQFSGEWYMMKTVFEAPYEAGFFNGQGGWPLGKKIRFEVTQRYLYAFNASPNVRNTDSEVTPVAAWPITRHFDIKPAINYSTGEPTNVIIEESRDGIPWYQRKYMRVRWERSLMSDWSDIIGTYYRWMGRIRTEPALYVPPEKMEISENYMTFVNEQIINQVFNSYYNYFLYEIPMATSRVKFRYSFKKVPTNMTYSPKEYNDYMLNKFGVFRTTVVQFHPDRGIVDWSYKFFANRHNVATGDEVKAYAANNTPEAQQKPKKIIYYLSPDFPQDLMQSVREIANDWNSAFAFALGREAKEGDKNAVFDILANNDGLPKGQRRELGDLRYNFVWWVNQPQTGSPLGYGPSLADPDTGEIVHGSAYVYGAGLRRITETYMILFDLLTGRYGSDEIVNGLEYFNSAFNLNGHRALLGVPTTSNQKYITTDLAGPQTRINNVQKMMARIQSPDFQSRMTSLRQLDRSMITSQIARLTESKKANQLMMHDFAAQMAFPGANTADILTSNDPEIKEKLYKYHPAAMVQPHNLRARMEAYTMPSRMNMYMAEYADPILASYVQYHASQGTPRDKVRQDLFRFMFVAVTAHEIGHTFGLMHNFVGSTDEYNFHNAYHDLKEGKTPTSCSLSGAACSPDKINSGANLTATQKEALAKLGLKNPAQGFFRNASIMDYAGEMYDDHIGVAKTDRAAITFIYAGKVEKAVNDPRETGELIPWSMEVERENQKPNGTIKLRPFKYCSDYLVGQNPFCQRWDSGINAQQIVTNYILNYDRLYPLRYFRRGRRAYSPSYAFGRFFGNLQHMATIYQDWSYRIATQPNYRQTADFDDKMKAVQNTFDFFMRIMMTPRIGTHEKNRITGVWERGVSNAEVDDFAPKHTITLGEGRFFFSSLQDGYFGIYRFRRTGALFDKWLAMMSMSIRSWGYYNNSVNWLYTNYHDFFTEDSTSFFSQGLASVWNPKSNLLYRKKGDPIEPGWHPFLQYNGMGYALGLINNPFHDRTFSNYMMVGVKGSGMSWTPPGMPEVQCPGINANGQYNCNIQRNVVCFNNFHSTRTYFAVQTQDKNGISFRLAERGCNLANQLANLRNSGAERSFLERKQGELELVETVLTIMQFYTSLFQG